MSLKSDIKQFTSSHPELQLEEVNFENNSEICSLKTAHITINSYKYHQQINPTISLHTYLKIWSSIF